MILRKWRSVGGSPVGTSLPDVCDGRTYRWSKFWAWSETGKEW